MSNSNHRAYLSETSHHWQGTEVRQVTFSDVSAEIIIEALSKVTLRGWKAGVKGKSSPLSTRFRQRLANVREA